MQVIVQKYGGSSVSTVEKIRAVAEKIVQVRRQGRAIVVVVSAMGDTTDHLVELARQVGPGLSLRDLDMLLSISSEISGKVLCALGDFSTSPVTATIKNFRDEYIDHIRSGRSFNSRWVPPA